VLSKQQEVTSTKSNEAFSRVDLLTVVAMVAALLVIVLSVRATPRNRVYQATDISNHRQNMQAMISYASDHSDTVPYSGWNSRMQNWLWSSTFPFSVGSGSLASYQMYYAPQLASVTNGQLFPYLKDPRVFMCPADRPSDPLFFARSQYVSSYVWNAAISGGGSLSVFKFSQFRPDAILEWETDEKTPFYMNDSTSWPDEGVSLRHEGTIQFGMFGGGVGSVSATTWYGNTMAGPIGSPHGTDIPSLPNRLWCNPATANGTF
jgi:hypothetical protein